MRAVILILLMPILAFGQDSLPVSGDRAVGYYFDLYASTSVKQADVNEQFKEYLEKLESKRQRFKNDQEFLKYAFHKTHQKFLKRYEEYVPFPEMFDGKKYNCLTGTALYALMLSHFDFQFQIIETNYHIFLQTSTKEGKIIFEATDPVNGFVNGDENISKRIAQYKAQALAQNEQKKVYYKYNCEIFNEVSLDELAGLLYYNEAIAAYNAQNLSLAVTHLDKTISSYTSPRVDEFSKILLLTLAESKMEPSAKADYVKKLKSLATKMPGVSTSTIE